MNILNANPGLFALTMNAMQLGVILLDREGHILLWNDWMEKHSGIAAPEAQRQKITGLFPALAGSRFEEALHYAGKSRLPSILSPALHRSPLPLFQSKLDQQENRRLQQLIHIIPLASNDQEPCILIQISDMTTSINRENQLRKLAAELEHINLQDAVTGIGNRRQFDRSLVEEIRRAKRTALPLALLMIDIDHFKLYNDYYGHPQGDVCLKRIAGALQSGLRRAGDVAARYGGEEFGIILPGMDEQGASEFAEEIRQHVAALEIPHYTSAVIPHLTISIGIAAFLPGQEIADPNALLVSADAALYEAKNQGRNRAILFSFTDNELHACPLSRH
jgi:diguanylate cyclase (GGDEF)-like protein